MPCAPPLPKRVLLSFFLSWRPNFFWPTMGNCVLRRPSWLSKDVILPPAWTRVGHGSHLMVTVDEVWPQLECERGAAAHIFKCRPKWEGRRVIRP